METEVDLREYVRILRHGWMTIAAITVAFALATFALTSFVLPKYYTAEALIYLSPPTFQVRLDDALSTNLPSSQILGSLTQIALSDAVISQLIDTVRPQLSEPASTLRVSEFQRNVLSTETLDATILRLSVRWTDPTESAQIAAAWAQIFVQNASVLLGYQTPGRIAALETERDTAQAHYESAEQALVSFQTQTPLSVLEAQLEDLRDNYSQLLAQSNRIDLLLLSVDALHSVFSAQAADTAITAGDALSMISLQLDWLSTGTQGSGSTNAASLQTGDLLSTGQTYGDLLNKLDAYQIALAAQQTALKARIPAVTADLQTAAGNLQQANNRLALLQSETDHALSTYQTLLNAINSLQSLSETTGNAIQIGAAPVAPDAPSEPRVIVSTMMALAVGLVVGVLVVFLSAYLRSPTMSTPSSQGTSSGVSPYRADG